MSQESLFSKLQQLIIPIWELNQQKAAIEEKEAELKVKTDERGESLFYALGAFGFILFPVLSFVLSKWVIPDGIVSLLCSIPVVSFVTKILLWQAEWYISLIVYGVAGFFSVAANLPDRTYKIGHPRKAKEISVLEKERDEMVKKCQEQEKDLDSQMQELGIPSYYRTYEAVVGIVAAYNLGWGNDLSNTIAAYEFNSSRIDDWGAAAFDPIRKADTGAVVNSENCYEDNINGNNAENVSRETFTEDTEVAVGTAPAAAATQKTDYFSELYMRQAAYERYMEHKKNA